MIMRGTTPRTLSWRGLLLVFGLGAFLLPLLPVFAQAEDPGKKEQADEMDLEIRGKLNTLEYTAPLKFSTGEYTFSRVADPANTADLDRLQAQLDKKLREIKDLQAKIRSLQDKLHQVEGTEPQWMFYRLLVEQPKGGAPQEILLRKVGDKWEVVDPKDVKATEMRLHPPMSGGFSSYEGPLNLSGLPFGVSDPAGMILLGQPRSEPDRRLDELEKKLEKVLQLMEQMRKDEKDPRRK